MQPCEAGRRSCLTPVVGFTVREAHLDDSGCWDHGAPHPARRRTGFVFVRESSLGRLHGDIRSLPTSKERVPTSPPSATVVVFRFLAIGMLFFGCALPKGWSRGSASRSANSRGCLRRFHLQQLANGSGKPPCKYGACRSSIRTTPAWSRVGINCPSLHACVWHAA